MEFGSAVLGAIGAFYSATDDTALVARAADLRANFQHVGAALGDGPWFAGPHFGLVDAMFGPVFRYFDMLTGLKTSACWPGYRGWRLGCV